MPDHIHLLVSCKPQLRLSDAVQVAVHGASGIEGIPLGRASVGPILLCCTRQRAERRSDINIQKETGAMAVTVTRDGEAFKFSGRAWNITEAKNKALGPYLCRIIGVVYEKSRH